MFAPNNQWILLNEMKVRIPEIYITCAILTVFLYGTVYAFSGYYRYPLMGTVTSRLSVWTLRCTRYLYINNPLTDAEMFNGMFVETRTLTWVKVLLVLVSLGVLSVTNGYHTKRGLHAFERPILMVLSLIGMLLLVTANDLLSFYLALERQSFCFYIMATLNRSSEASTEAGLKYFLLGAISSGILLFGGSILYGMTGSTNFTDWSKFFWGGDYVEGHEVVLNHAVQLGMTFFFVGILFKMTAAPFHMWAPDVYQGAPTSVTLYFSTVPKVAILTIAWRVAVEAFQDFAPQWENLLQGAALASLVIGTFGALAQTTLKRFMAYSSIGHVGFLLLPLVVHTNESYQSLMLYLLLYLLMTMGTFILMVNLYKVETGVRYFNKKDASAYMSKNTVTFLSDVRGLGKSQPMVAMSLIILLFSMAGVPPLGGFFSKLYLLWAGVKSSGYVLVWVALVMSLVSAFYYVRILRLAYFDPTKVWVSHTELTGVSAYILGSIMLIRVFFFLHPAPFLLWAEGLSTGR